MEEIPITGLEELERHVQHLVEAPETPLDAKLFDEVELQLTGKLFPRLQRVCLDVLQWGRLKQVQVEGDFTFDNLDLRRMRVQMCT
jgi:hypothetical protein